MSIVAYGVNRKERDFASESPDRFYIDLDAKERPERGDLLKWGVVDGDTLVIFSWAELARGGERSLIAAQLEKMGVKVKVIEGPAKGAKQRGPKAKFQPTPEQRERICGLWAEAGRSQAYVLRRASEIMGYPVDRNALNHACGPRSKPKPKSPKQPK
jgi:hypothetical protein